MPDISPLRTSPASSRRAFPGNWSDNAADDRGVVASCNATLRTPLTSRRCVRPVLVQSAGGDSGRPASGRPRRRFASDQCVSGRMAHAGPHGLRCLPRIAAPVAAQQVAPRRRADSQPAPGGTRAAVRPRHSAAAGADAGLRRPSSRRCSTRPASPRACAGSAIRPPGFKDSEALVRAARLCPRGALTEPLAESDFDPNYRACARRYDFCPPLPMP